MIFLGEMKNEGVMSTYLRLILVGSGLRLRFGGAAVSSPPSRVDRSAHNCSAQCQPDHSGASRIVPGAMKRIWLRYLRGDKMRGRRDLLAPPLLSTLGRLRASATFSTSLPTTLGIHLLRHLPSSFLTAAHPDDILISVSCAIFDFNTRCSWPST
nr:hypothetical protein CFP56_50440 [Quercus suber]